VTTSPASTRRTDLRLFQTMAGARHGGAELFFERLAIGFNDTGMNQQLMIKPDNDRMARLTTAGLDVTGCGFSPLLATLHRRRIAAAIRRNKPDVILSWMNRATMMTPPAGRPHVARLGGFYNLKYYRGCDWLVANTRDIADYLIANGVPRERVHYQINFVPDGREGSIFGGPVSEGKRGDGPVIAALGRLHENKAFDTLIRAFAALPDGRLWLAGEGPERTMLGDLANELGIASRVAFLGWQDDPQSIIRGADILVCPSRHEPFGNVIAEGMACGKPVISTQTNGGCELIEDGVNGLLVPVDDVDALADALAQLATDVALAARLAEGGRSCWQATLSPQRVTGDWIDFLERVAV
jgi:glycosyltransferase involved in cell wall biosynthesis